MEIVDKHFREIHGSPFLDNRKNYVVLPKRVLALSRAVGSRHAYSPQGEGRK
jgi:hypothetical protein